MATKFKTSRILKLFILAMIVILVGSGIRYLTTKRADSPSSSTNAAANDQAQQASHTPINPADVQQVVDDWLATTSSADDWAVYIESLEDGQKLASQNADKQFNIASVYKLFILEALADKVPVGDWDTETVNGHRIELCVDYMIRLSDNACAEAFGEFIGWRSLDNAISAAGYKATSLNRIPPLSTVNDTSEVLRRLNSKQLLDEPAHKLVMEAMEKPKNTSEAIRHGCQACTVWNKPGEFGSGLADVAIIEKDGRKYSLVFFTEGGSWAQIIELTQAVTDKL